MGLLEVEIPSASDFLESTPSTAGLVESFTVTAGTVTAAQVAPLASLVLPVVARTYFKAGAQDIATSADQKLQDISEQRDQNHVKWKALSVACDGICRVLSPFVKEYPNDYDLATFAREHPNRFQAQVRELFNEENHDVLRELDAELAELFTPGDGDRESIDQEDRIDELHELFGLESRQETLRLFLLFVELIEDIGVQLESEATTGDDSQMSKEAEESIADSARRVGELATWIREGLVRLQLGNQNFRQITVGTFHDEPFSTLTPLDAWASGRGFGFPEIAATHSNGERYVFDRPISRSSTGETESIQSHLMERLSDGENVVVTGAPGMGKSLLGKKVAVEWIDETRGAVFHRGTEGAVSGFDKVQALEDAIRDAKDVGDGHVLVVMEDATRSGSRPIFEVMERLRGNRDVTVSFLLDARTSEWKDFAQENPNRLPWLEATGSEYLSRFEIPGVGPETCKSARKTFNRTTYGYCSRSAEDLYDEVSSKNSNNELLVLVSQLLNWSRVSESSPLSSSARKIHSDLLDEATYGGDDAPLAYRVALTINILNASEIGVHPDLLYSLADTHRERQDVDQVLRNDERISGTMLLSDNLRESPFYTRHPEWSHRFLTYATVGGDSAEQNVANETLLAVVRDVVSLADDEEKRRNIAEYLEQQGVESTRYLSKFGDEPSNTVEELLTTMYEFANKHPILVPLFEEPLDGDALHAEERLPDAAPPGLEYELRLIFGRMVQRCGGITNLGEYDPTDAFDIWASTSEELANSTKYDEQRRKQLRAEAIRRILRNYSWQLDESVVREYGERAVELYRDVGGLEGEAEVLGYASSSAEEAQISPQEVRHRRKDIYEEIGDTRGLLDVYSSDVRRALCADRTKDARQYFRKWISIRRNEDFEFPPLSPIHDLATSARSQGDYEKAIKYREFARDVWEEVGDEFKVAHQIHSLGTLARKDEKYDTAYDYLCDAKQIYEKLESRQSLVSVLLDLAACEQERGNHGEAISYAEEALELNENDPHHEREIISVLVENKREEGDYSGAYDVLNELIDRYEERGNDERKAKVFGNIAKTALSEGDLDKAENYYNKKLDVFESIERRHSAAKAKQGLANVAAKRGQHELAVERYDEFVEDFLLFIETRHRDNRVGMNYHHYFEELYESLQEACKRTEVSSTKRERWCNQVKETLEHIGLPSLYSQVGFPELEP